MDNQGSTSMYHHPPPKPKRCIVERVLVEVPGANSLTIFRQAFHDEGAGDNEHRKWLATGLVPPVVAERCEHILNEAVLDRISDRQLTLLDEDWSHLTGAMR